LKVDLVICTRNPDPAILKMVIDSIHKQSGQYDRLIIIDNGSNPPVTELGFKFEQETRVFFEKNPGLIHARVLGLRKSSADLIIFVDDDNELANSYVEVAVNFMASNPNVGTIGGVCRLPSNYKFRKVLGPLIEGLGIRNYGNSILIGNSVEWGKSEPIGAGMVLTREVADNFIRKYEQFPLVRSLGRGAKSILGGEDAYIVRCAYELGRSSAYVPQLQLTHWIGEHRLGFKYLLRLSYGYGRSRVRLNRALEESSMPSAPISPMKGQLRKSLLFRLKQHPIRGVFYFAGDLGELRESLTKI
jgi:glycosyltransferase involved in cell wall biosynthesis